MVHPASQWQNQGLDPRAWLQCPYSLNHQYMLPVGVNQPSVVGEVKRQDYDCPGVLLSLKTSGNEAKVFSLVMMFTLAELRGEVQLL